MAEFCKKCAPKYGMLFDGYSLFCEGCGEYFEEKSFWKRIGEFLRKIFRRI